MKGENNILLFGEFLGVVDHADSSTGFDLHWETEDKTLIRDISASSRTIVIVLNDGTSYSLGFNASGQLGIGSLAFCASFTKVSSSTPFDLVTCGTNFTIWRSSTTDEIFVSGLGFNSCPQRFIMTNNNGKSLKVLSMDSYDDSFAAIEESGIVYLWPHFTSSNTTNSNNDNSEINGFITCLLPSKPSEISCGNGFASILSNGYVFRVLNDGSFYPLFNIKNSLHYLSFSSQIGTSNISSISSAPMSPSSASSTISHSNPNFTSTDSNSPYSPPPLAVSVKSSADYSIVLDSEGSVWLYGTIGGLNRHIENVPIARGMKSIFAMNNFCAFVNNIGVTYTFGLNDSGQLADGSKTKRTRVVETKVEKPVISVVGGRTFSVFVCNQFDSSLFEVNMDEFVPGHMNCPFEKAEDMIDATTTP